MIQKKSFLMAIKRALETGGFNYVGQQVDSFPDQLWHIDDIKMEDQNWWQCNPIVKVDVSNNEITSIPEGIVNLPDLQLIRMKNNKVKEIPGCLFGLQNLKSLDVSRNMLVSVPQNISEWPSLVELNISENNLEHCPNLEKIKNLEVLYMNDNKIQNMPCLGTGLKKVEASSNRIRQIRKRNFELCKNLQYLNLTKNWIERIEEDSFRNAQNLISIELKQNRLVEFRELPKSNKLDTVSLAFNRLTQFSYFDHCPNLTILILADNKIKKLSKDIIKLSKLKTLDVSNNDLPDLPCQIGFINSLVRIQVQGNPLKSVRQSIRTGGTNVIKKYLRDKMDPNEKVQIQNKTGSSFQKINDGQYWSKLLYEFTQNGELVLRKMELNSLSESVYEKELRGINISDNKVKELSNSIIKLQNLKYLIANNNQLQCLPDVLSQLNVQLIQVKHNKLSTLTSASLYGFKNLNYLDLSANRIIEVPKVIMTIPRLRTLHLSYNNLSNVECLWNPNNLPQLQVLDISSNKIVDISDEVFKKYKLNYLNIQNNNLTRIPTVLGFMKLSGLKIDGNPLKLIKRTVIDKGTVSILDYLRTRHQGQIPDLPKQSPKKQPQYVPEKPQYPYETQPKEVKKQEKQVPAVNNQFKKQKIKELQKQIASIQNQIDNNMSMNSMQKTQKKKLMQSLMIERNKLLKQ